MKYILKADGGGEELNPLWVSDDVRWAAIRTSWETSFQHITGVGAEVGRRSGERRGALLTCKDQAQQMKDLIEGTIFSEHGRKMLLDPELGFMTTNFVETLGASIGRVRTKTVLRPPGLDRMLVWSALNEVQSLRLFAYTKGREVWLPFVRALEIAEEKMSLPMGTLATPAIRVAMTEQLNVRHTRNE